MSLAARIGQVVQSILQQATTVDHGAAQAGGQVFTDEALEGSAAWERFAWVRACVDAIATDLAGLPLVVDVAGEQQRQHPVLALLAAPETTASGVLWRQQLVMDLLLTGNWFGLCLGAPGKLPLSVARLHPEQVQLEVGPGGIRAFAHNAGGLTFRYAPQLVLHARMPSMATGIQGMIGRGLVQALRDDLTLDWRTSRLAATVAARGRPEAILSPKEGTTLTAPQREAIAAQYKRLTGEGGVLVLSGGMDLQLPSWSPRDMEWQAGRVWTRETILAAFGVPPGRVGLPTANYATQRQQDLVYWTNLMGRARLIEPALSMLLARSGQAGVVRFDFGGVPVLQEQADARLARVERWYMLGADPGEAASFEGFAAHPLPASLSADGPRRAPAPVQRLAPPSAAFTAWWTTGQAPAIRVVSSADERAALWRAGELTTRLPAERSIGRAVKAALDLQLQAATRAVEAAQDGQRSIIARTFDLEAVLAAIFGQELDSQLRDQVAPSLRQAWLAGHAQAATRLRRREELPAWAAAQATRAQLGELIANLNQYTAFQVKGILEVALSSGWSVGEIQGALVKNTAFSAARALRVARSEAAPVVGMGQLVAFQEAAMAGVKLRKTWLATADSVTRESHSAMDGQTVEVEAEFTTPEGLTALCPGKFSAAKENVNCRCGMAPDVEE